MKSQQSRSWKAPVGSCRVFCMENSGPTSPEGRFWRYIHGLHISRCPIGLAPSLFVCNEMITFGGLSLAIH
jgi:hypothetical protein